MMVSTERSIECRDAPACAGIGNQAHQAYEDGAETEPLLDADTE